MEMVMSKVLLAGVSVIAVTVGAAAAMAADIPQRRAAPREPIYTAYNWTGPYVGINGGGAWGSSNFSAPFTTGSFNTSGAQVGGTLGYNYQVGQGVFGIEGDID
jgi:outer membrane immunogenic protein